MGEEMTFHRRLPQIVLGLAFAYLVFCFQAPKPTDFNAWDFGRLPVLQNGRVKPLDTVARVSLLMIRGKQTIPVEVRSTTDRESGPDRGSAVSTAKITGPRTLGAIDWLLDVMARPEKADEYKAFVINDPDVLSLLGKEQERERYFSFKEIEPGLKGIEVQASQAEPIE